MHHGLQENTVHKLPNIRAIGLFYFYCDTSSSTQAHEEDAAG